MASVGRGAARPHRGNRDGWFLPLGNTALLLSGPDFRKRLARYNRRRDNNDAPQQNANPLRGSNWRPFQGVDS
jgi:hypothetical protein